MPALSFWLEHRPAHASRCPAVGKRLMSLPISARMVVADKVLTPGYGEEESDQRSKAGRSGRSLRVHRLDGGADFLVDAADRGGCGVVLTQV